MPRLTRLRWQLQLPTRHQQTFPMQKGGEIRRHVGMNISPRLFQRIGDVFGVPQVGRTVRAAATSNIQNLANITF